MAVTEAHLSPNPFVNLGCGTHYAQGWTNLDVVENDDIHPDLIVTGDDPLPFQDCSVQRLYLGHVLEHVPWEQVPELLAKIRRVLGANGEVCAVGPDAYRTIERYKAGLEPWELVASVLEDSQHYQQTADDWPEARHHWNCHEARVVGLLAAAGFQEVTPIPMVEGEIAFEGWPVVSFAPWQCAVRATR